VIRWRGGSDPKVLLRRGDACDEAAYGNNSGGPISVEGSRHPRLLSHTGHELRHPAHVAR
jgi:hypothetical protein